MKKWLLLGTLFLSMPAMAEMPSGVDPESPIHQWFERQTSLGTMHNGVSCCEISDGHILGTDEWKMDAQGNASVFIKGEGGALDQWYKIPKERWVDLKPGDPNPTGAAIVWYKWYFSKGEEPSLEIWCFTPGILF